MESDSHRSPGMDEAREGERRSLWSPESLIPVIISTTKRDLASLVATGLSSAFSFVPSSPPLPEPSFLSDTPLFGLFSNKRSFLIQLHECDPV